MLLGCHLVFGCYLDLPLEARMSMHVCEFAYVSASEYVYVGARFLGGVCVHGHICVRTNMFDCLVCMCVHKYVSVKVCVRKFVRVSVRIKVCKCAHMCACECAHV